MIESSRLSRKQLEQQMDAAGAKRRPDGELPAAVDCARHQQIGDVGASNQQDEAHRAKENQ